MTLNRLPAQSPVLLCATAVALFLCSCADDDLGLVEGTVTRSHNQRWELVLVLAQDPGLAQGQGHWMLLVVEM